MWDNDEVANESETEKELHAILVFARSLKGKVIIVEVDRTDNALVHQVDNGIQQRQTKNTDESLLEPEKKKNVIRTGQSCLFMPMRVQAVEIHRAIHSRHPDKLYTAILSSIPIKDHESLDWKTIPAALPVEI
jgi:hypothetical protein